MAFLDTDCGMEIEDGCLPCKPDEEKRIIKELGQAAESNLGEGNIYYVLSNRWWRQWQSYVDQDGKGSLLAGDVINSLRPGPIDNTNLILTGTDTDNEGPELLRSLLEGDDYVLVSEDVWKTLHGWYKGGPALPRKMISQGKSFIIEVYPLCLNVIDSRKSEKKIVRISKMASVRDLYDRICAIFKLDSEKVRIWDYFGKKKNMLLNTFNQTLNETTLQMDQEMLLEVEKDGLLTSGGGMDSRGNELALVPIEPSRSPMSIAGGPIFSNGYSSSGYQPSFMRECNLGAVLRENDEKYDVLGGSRVKDGCLGGLAGLVNLGNTCFMNSAIQCLVHTSPLVEYFLQDYSDEINRDNPIGMEGELAIAFGDLLRKMWSSDKPIAPRAFKAKLARFAPQFSGYNQHDSQELLAFLLDGLHEDLNRIRKKPYIEAKDAEGCPDEEFAEQCWLNHKARNDSVIVDACQGQYKSTLVCPSCNKVSVMFDPFMYLSLQLPSTVTRQITATVFYCDGSTLPMPFTVNVPKHGSLKDLFQALVAVCCLQSNEKLFLVEIYDHKVFRYLDNPSEPLLNVRDEDHIVAYRMYRDSECSPQLEILHWHKERPSTELHGSLTVGIFGTPLVCNLPEGPVNASMIQAAVATVLAPLSRKKALMSVRSQGKANREPHIDYNCDNVLVNGGTCSSPEGMKLSSVSAVEFKKKQQFDLFITDPRGMNRVPIKEDFHMEGRQVVRVLMEWSKDDHDSYDASYLENLPEVCKFGLSAKKTRQEPVSLFSCLEAFLMDEPLGPDDMWYCPQCKEHRQASKKLDLWRLPNILIIHLKRFSYGRYFKNKLDTLVSFPVNNLDLSKFVKREGAAPSSYVYNLYAVSNHYGGLGGGHYTAHAKLLDDNRWYHFDDSYVSPASEDSIRTSAAYLLFYQRVNNGEHSEPLLS